MQAWEHRYVVVPRLWLNVEVVVLSRQGSTTIKHQVEHQPSHDCGLSGKFRFGSSWIAKER